jgi:ABC-type dipeptide/oligopeptide/nickel transport system permease component
VWTYIARRLLLLLPTLFGITIIAFCIMQLAPGDPLLSQLGAGGQAGASGQTREGFLIQKRDLKLDRPLLLNFRYFHDYTHDVEIAAHFRALSHDQIADELELLAGHPEEQDLQRRLGFLRSLRIKRFDRLLNPRELTDQQLRDSNLTRDEWETERRAQQRSLAPAVAAHVQVWCEDAGNHPVPTVMQVLRSPDATQREKIGAIKCLVPMVESPFVYTYSRDSTEAEAEKVHMTWSLLWEREQSRFAEVPAQRREVLQRMLDEMAAATRAEMFKILEEGEESGELTPDDVPFFVEVVLGEAPHEQKVVAAEFLRLFVGRIRLDVRLDATPHEVDEVANNWLVYYEAAQDRYHPAFGKRLTGVLVDTQYAHMVWRLVTFRFGRSTFGTHDPVGRTLWNAVIVSAPLMLMAQLVIYFVAIPLGILCSVQRGRWGDRLISLGLFLLYSIPGFVAGMLFLLFFCYGDYLKWFPMDRLHSPGAENFGFARYMIDYLWHAALPVICLSLFSLAALAMYSRSSMLDVLEQDYIRTARAKGVSPFLVTSKHALRNGLIPVITLFANFLPAMLGGSVLIEVIFDIPGMGRLSFDSIERKDVPMLMALIYIDAIVVMLSILLADVLYVLVDPRISFEGQGKS